jgi:hypothetical protein
MAPRLRNVRRAARLLRTWTAAVVLAGGLWAGAGAGTAHAASGIDPIDASSFQLTALPDHADDIGQLAQNPALSTQSLTGLAGTGTAGRSGLCYPTPFNPGVHAAGYCWDDSADESGTNGWAPQGLSLPHAKTSDGTWGGHRWEVTSWHAASDSLAKLRFIDRDSATPRYVDVLLITPGTAGAFTTRPGHVDSVVWYGDNLLVGYGKRLDVYQLGDLRRDSIGFQGFTYLLPVRYSYSTTGPADGACASVTGNGPCLNAMSFDRADQALTSAEYVQDNAPGGRLVRWPFDLDTGLPVSATAHGSSAATAAWVSPVWHMQGVVFADSAFFISGTCPSSFDNGYRESDCIHKAAPGAAPSVLTAAPDMTQNLDYDAGADRIHGVNEVDQAGEVYPQRVVFDIDPSAGAISTVRFKNVNSGKCLLPYGASLNNGADVVQWDCDGTSPQNWYWSGDTIRNFQSGRCLTVYGGSSTKGALLVQWDCNGSASQEWTRATGAAGDGSILFNGESAQCLTIYGGSTTNGADAVQWPCDATNPAHSWVGSAT